MTEAKVPDEKSDWQALDIFLFSNGQESSPPRKYHLETSELHWWDLTLNYLARAHFGSIHSQIELYSIEGQKIETPMELSHGAAYVAVVPPEPFIDSGYENYLMKASRSWEKGQARRDSGTKLSPSDSHKIRDDESSSNKKYREVTNIEDQEHNSVDPNKAQIVASTVENVTSDLVKPQHAGNKLIYNKSLRGIAAKPPDRRKSTVPQSPLIVKKIGSISSPPAARKSSIKRKDSVKINASPKNATPTRGSNNFLSNSKLCKQYKQQNILPDVILSKLEEVTDIKSPSSAKQVGDNSDLSSKSAERKSSIQNKETAVVSTVYRNPRNSLQPSISLDPHASFFDNGKMLVTELFRENNQNVENKHEKEENELDETVINIPINPLKLHTFGEYYTGTEVLSSPKTTSENADKNIDVFNKEGTVNLSILQECFTSTEEPKTPCNSADKNIDLINKEATVNLKLYIEIQNTRFDPKADTVPTSKENGQKIKVEKGSQVNIEEKIAEHDKLHTVICNEIETKNIDGNPNVTIVKCACTSQGGDSCSANTLPINIGNSKFVIILPLSNYDERLNSDLTSEQNQISAEQIERFSLTSNPVKRTISCLSLLKREIASHGVLTSSNNLQDVKNDQPELSLVKHKSVAIREGQFIFSEPNAEEPVKLSDSKILDTPASDASKKESLNQFKTADEFTQTELCDMMLEARLNDDGHYSFHVPSLKMLKNYKL